VNVTVVEHKLHELRQIETAHYILINSNKERRGAQLIILIPDTLIKQHHPCSLKIWKESSHASLITSM